VFRREPSSRRHDARLEFAGSTQGMRMARETESARRRIQSSTPHAPGNFPVRRTE
jgi:hypothetical protein